MVDSSCGDRNFNIVFRLSAIVTEVVAKYADLKSCINACFYSCYDAGMHVTCELTNCYM